jgi:hypothetical protein
MDLVLENIRTFAGRYELSIAPLTLLIGENSTGKSTLLGALAALSNASGYPTRPTFNEPPFNLGSFNNILTNVRRRNIIAKHFTLGYRDLPSRYGTQDAEAKFVGSRGKVLLSKFFIKNPKGELTCQLVEGTENYEAKLTFNDKKLNYEFSLPSDRTHSAKGTPDFGSLYQQAMEEKDYPAFDALVSLTSRPNPLSIQSVAPIRSKPSRTYDQVTEEFSPEGTHVPYLLARVLTDKSPSETERYLVRTLNEYGKNSGLYRSLKVKKLGENVSDPFQILVGASGKAVNLMDVGYGVSQVLPVIIQSVLSDTPSVLLLQQPEVHLHPKAQAALGSLFAGLVENSSGEHRFVVETHSDYLLDRVRQEVAQGSLNSKYVSIAFLELRKGISRLHQLQLDRYGNIQKAPSSYRQFFLQEELNLLNRTSR